jgi:hypothetical protein
MSCRKTANRFQLYHSPKSTSLVVNYPAFHTKTSLRLVLREEYKRETGHQNSYVFNEEEV